MKRLLPLLCLAFAKNACGPAMSGAPLFLKRRNEESGVKTPGYSSAFPVISAGRRTLGGVFASALLCLAFAGCASYPPGACDSWTHEGRYGAVATHYEAKDVKADGATLKIGQWHGSVTFLGGYGISDTVTGLVVPAKTP